MDKTKLSIILLIISLILIVAAVLINSSLDKSQSNSYTVKYKYNSKPVSNSAGVYLGIEKTPQNSGGINGNQ